MQPDELDEDQGVEEVLVLRVVSEAHRRRVRRLVTAAMLVIVVGGAVAVGLSHRSAAESPLAKATPTVRYPTGGVVADALDSATRAEIYAAASTRYPTGSGRVGRTHVEFGRLAVHGDRATLEVNVECVPLCGHGEVVTLAKRDGTWRVVAARQTWVS